MTLRILAVAAFIVGIILFAVFALASAPNLKDLAWGFVAIAAGLICLALEGVPTRLP